MSDIFDDHSIDHTDIQRAIAHGRTLRSRAVHAAIAAFWAGVKQLVRADQRARHIHHVRHLSADRLRDVGLTEADIMRVKLSRGELPF